MRIIRLVASTVVVVFFFGPLIILANPLLWLFFSQPAVYWMGVAYGSAWVCLFSAVLVYQLVRARRRDDDVRQRLTARR